MTILAVLVLIVVLAAGCWYVSTRHDKRHVTLVGLERRAYQQHRYVMCGDPRGFWGDYPPAPTHDLHRSSEKS